EDGIRDFHVTGVQTCALPIFLGNGRGPAGVFGQGAPVVLRCFHRPVRLGRRSRRAATEGRVAGGGGRQGGRRVETGASQPGPGRSEERRVGKEPRCRGRAEHV